jgi:hypothetical protein
MESMRRTSALRGALARLPSQPCTQFSGDEKPLVHVRAVYGRAVAYTPTHVLWEWVRYGEYHCRWDEKWQVKRVEPEEWHGEELD